MSLRRAAAGLCIGAAVSAAVVLGNVWADVRAVPNPPTFTPEEVALIAKDARLTQAVKACPWQLRQALDAWDDIRNGARPQPIEAEPCRVPADDGMGGRASDEAALDILKILKEAAGQGTAR
jgi:hypothetical protein